MIKALTRTCLALLLASCVPTTEDPNPYGGIELRTSLAPGVADPWTTSDGWRIEILSVQSPLFIGFAGVPSEGNDLRPCTSGSFRAEGPTDLLVGPVERLFKQVDVGPCALVLIPGYASIDAQSAARLQGRATAPDGFAVVTFDIPLSFSAVSFSCREDSGAPVVLEIVNRQAVHVEVVVDAVSRFRILASEAAPLVRLDTDRDGQITIDEVAAQNQFDLTLTNIDVRLGDGRACPATASSL